MPPPRCSHRDSADEPDRAARAHVVAGLLDEEPTRRRDGITGATAWIADSAQAVVTVVEGAPAAALRSVLDSAARRDPRRCLTAVVQDTGVLVRTGTHLDPVEMAEQAERMVAATVRLAPGSTVTAGIGEAAPGLATAWRSGRQARAAARGARRVPGLGPVTRWTALGPYTPLLMLPDGAVTAALVPEPVERLLAHRKAVRLVPTLRTFLDTPAPRRAPPTSCTSTAPRCTTASTASPRSPAATRTTARPASCCTWAWGSPRISLLTEQNEARTPAPRP